MFDAIPTLELADIERSAYYFGLLRYIGLAFLGAAITFVYQLYIIAEKKKGLFSFSKFIKENLIASLTGCFFSALIVSAAYLTGILNIEFGFAHNSLAIFFGASVNGAVSYYSDHIIKVNPDLKSEVPNPNLKL